MAPPSKLAVLPLSYPLIVLPASRLTVPVSADVAAKLFALVESAGGSSEDFDEHGTHAMIAAVPVVSGEPNAELSQYGCCCRVLRLIKPSPRSAQQTRQPYLLSLSALTRIRLRSVPDTKVLLPKVEVVYAELNAPSPSEEDLAVFKRAAMKLLDLLTRGQQRKELWVRLATMLEDVNANRAAWMADVLVAAVSAEYSDRLDFLSVQDPSERINLATRIFTKQVSISEVSSKIASAVDENLSRQQKEYFLRQQLAAIQKELREIAPSNSNAPSLVNGGPKAMTNGPNADLDENNEDGEDADILAMRVKLEAMTPGSEERKTGAREWKRLKRMPAGSVESGVVRTYLEWLTSLPWPTYPSKSIPIEMVSTRAFLNTARTRLDEDHFGLEKIKRRLIEYLAVVKLQADQARVEQGTMVVSGDTTPKKASVKGPILLFVGPPGVGKTSLGSSLAAALNRPFSRIALGGVRDEASIRGHRRTYVASAPGMIISALRKTYPRSDPVILLDEIDKVSGRGVNGDPSAALLEVLDPEQNHTFVDHYLGIPFDLSSVIFICTANSTSTIPGPLLDRCEVIQLSGYTHNEKLKIARQFLLPKQLRTNGLTASQVDIPEKTLLAIATKYTHEAGVRSLERAIGSVVRYKAVQWAEREDFELGKEKDQWTSIVLPEELEAILGVGRWDGEEREREERRGITYGLVVSGLGEGGVLPVETTMTSGSGKVRLTGSLGDVIKESAEIALTWVKTHASALGFADAFSLVDVHLHLPSGATPKDGPSAGIAMTCALVSLLTGKCVNKDTAMTGEITLRGRVTPVGGIKEKILGAHRAGIRSVILPFANRQDVLHDVAAEIRSSMRFTYARTVREVLDAAFIGSEALVWEGVEIVQSRL